ncbi:MAG: hypothetical protein ISR65_15935 [Bacteriovoracaceae bacterium]|nr:hypothetical protein [Bacteriovoracaceae bacterium]
MLLVCYCGSMAAMRLLVIILFTFSVSASDSDICSVGAAFFKDSIERALRLYSGLPPRIRINARPIKDVELVATGTVFPENKKIDQMLAGTWIYLIDQDKNIVMAPRIPQLLFTSDNASQLTPPFIATHRALFQKLLDYRWQQGTIVPLIFSAGEIRVVRGNKVQIINNRSGSYPGNHEHLQFAIKQFKKKGMDMNGALEYDFSMASVDPHVEVIKSAKIYYKVRADRGLREKADVLGALFCFIMGKFRSKDSFEMDMDRINRYLDKVSGELEEFLLSELYFITQVLTSIQNDGIEAATHSLFSKEALDDAISRFSKFAQIMSVVDNDQVVECKPM